LIYCVYAYIVYIYNYSDISRIIYLNSYVLQMYFNALQCHVICHCDFVKSAIHNSQFTELGSPATETALRQRINLAQEKQQAAQNPKNVVLFFGCFLHFITFFFV